MIKITEAELKELVLYVRSNFGINLEKKQVLIEGRLSSVLEKKGCKSFSEYLRLVKNDRTKQEERLLLDRITTNHTYFMRESNHFRFLEESLFPLWEKQGRYSIWSAGCSNGSEPYTIAMTIEEQMKKSRARMQGQILATDLSHEILAEAMKGVYRQDTLKDLPLPWQKAYFSDGGNNQRVIQPTIKSKVTYRPFNLMDAFPRQQHDLIFCRNVMIYFDQPTRTKLIQKFYEATKPGGYLFIGHSETIVKGSSDYRYVMPAIYQRVQ